MEMVAAIIWMVGIFFSGASWGISKSWWDVLVAAGCGTLVVVYLSIYAVS